MALSRIATAVGALLLSKGGRKFAGRHAGKLALATLAWELLQQKQARAAGQTQPQAKPHTKPRPAARERWSGRRV